MPTLYTIGHSNHSLDEFIEILQTYQITHLVDVRSIPKSRHVPWSNEKNLTKILQKNKISYSHMQILGGLRHTTKHSINLGWRNTSFRGYADYMQTPDFYTGLKELIHLLKQEKVAIMCAEAVPWRCHRSLISDALLVRKVNVLDILNKTSIHKHKLTEFAVVNRKKRPIQIVYPNNTKKMLGG